MSLWDGKGTVVPTGFKIASLNSEYEIVKLINDGASVSYFARRLADNRDVFFKHFKDPNQMQGKAYTDFINHQGKVFVRLKKLSSGKSVKTTESNFEFFEYSGCHFQAKEPIDGVSLNDFLYEDGQSKKIPFVTRLMIAKQMLEILHEIHQHGIIHSDLKPQQIMVSEDSSVPGGHRVTLIDFDHAVLVEADGTKIGEGAGTDTWFSPEHADNLPKEFATDVFTMSLMISDTMGAGHPYAEHLDDYKTAIFKQNAKRLCDVIKNDKLITIDEILFRALHPKHKERPSVMEMLDVINTFLSTGGKKKVQAIELHSNGKKFTIIKDIDITRDICKSNFGNHDQIYTNQFKVFKDNSGDWFVQGLTVPSTAKSKDGTVLTFYPTIYGGKDITNKPTKLEDNTQLVIGDTQFTVVMK